MNRKSSRGSNVLLSILVGVGGLLGGWNISRLFTHDDEGALQLTPHEVVWNRFAKQFDHLTADVTVTNGSNYAIEVTEVNASCGCTTLREWDGADLRFPFEVKGGESRKLRMNVDVGPRVGLHTFVAILKAQSRSDELFATCQLRARISPGIVLDPPFVSFEEAVPGSVLNKTVVIWDSYPDSGPAINIARVSDANRCKASISRLSATKQVSIKENDAARSNMGLVPRYAIDLEYKVPHEPCRNSFGFGYEQESDEILLETSDQNVPRLACPVYCRSKLPTISVLPPTLHISNKLCGTKIQRTIRVAVRDAEGAELQLAGVPQGFTASIQKDSSNEFVVDIRGIVPAAPDVSRSLMAFEFTTDNMEIVKVPLSLIEL